MTIPEFLCLGEWWSARQEDAGTLVLPTGRIVVSDPILDPFNKPFSRAVNPGNYPVVLSMVEDDVGLVSVYFADQAPVTWRATKPESFSVDSASACIMDQKVCRFLHRKAEDGNFDKYTHRFENALAENNGIWGNYSFQSGANVILFKTFGGDGTFCSYFGLDGDSEVVVLVIDMFFGDQEADNN